MILDCIHFISLLNECKQWLYKTIRFELIREQNQVMTIKLKTILIK